MPLKLDMDMLKEYVKDGGWLIVNKPEDGNLVLTRAKHSVRLPVICSYPDGPLFRLVILFGYDRKSKTYGFFILDDDTPAVRVELTRDNTMAVYAVSPVGAKKG